MPIGLNVRTSSGETLTACTHPALGDLCRRAATLALPMLCHVDPYDDTWFDKSQMRLLAPELEALIDSASAPEAEAAAEVLDLAEQLEHEPHRYLILIGQGACAGTPVAAEARILMTEHGFGGEQQQCSSVRVGCEPSVG
ncbi:hypothetical protein GCM10010495_73610 [Kitasatospora herbaricolor]|uniref:hypothetical protein n=1 Tax=Kitasatospora herbaricolor TaxID=68217 RepID=UPI00174BB192|nr:hypothetical protein [Kitasatospora herbaricolor]MDQ0305647.1 hypothetical protein [Kitasatospora herbaricolor]GGV45355.1 hypothetical protein GCM10010495_73610 [Kitasatospora herbaricolor]